MAVSSKLCFVFKIKDEPISTVSNPLTRFSTLQNQLQKWVFISLVSLKKLMKEKKPTHHLTEITCTHTRSGTCKSSRPPRKHFSRRKGHLSGPLQTLFISQRRCSVAAALRVLAGGAFSSVNSAASEESAARQ